MFQRELNVLMRRNSERVEQKLPLQNLGIPGSTPIPASFDPGENRTNVQTCITTAWCPRLAVVLHSLNFSSTAESRSLRQANFPLSKQTTQFIPKVGRSDTNGPRSSDFKITAFILLQYPLHARCESPKSGLFGCIYIFLSS